MLVFIKRGCSVIISDWKREENVYLSSVVCLTLLSTRPWDPLNDLIQFESDGCIQTKVRHRTPMVRSGSLISLSNQGQRRDNCKCQVGCPDRTVPSRRLSRLPPDAPPPLSLSCLWVVIAVLPPSLHVISLQSFIFCVPPPLLHLPCCDTCCSLR